MALYQMPPFSGQQGSGWLLALLARLSRTSLRVAARKMNLDGVLARLHNGLSRLLRNLRWGALWGLCGAVVYCAYGVVLFLLAGERPFAAKGTTFGAVMAAYLTGGVGAGLILGVLRPLGRWWWGSAVMGLVCSVPIWAAMIFAVTGHFYWKVVAVLSAVMGPVAGMMSKLRLGSEE